MFAQRALIIEHVAAECGMLRKDRRQSCCNGFTYDSAFRRGGLAGKIGSETDTWHRPRCIARPATGKQEFAAGTTRDCGVEKPQRNQTVVLLMLRDHLFDREFRHATYDSVHFLAVFEKDEARDSSDVELLRDARFFVHVHLYDFDVFSLHF